MIPPYDHEALWVKAKLFINRAMDDDARSFDEQALWASLSLELLAKAALARVSPLLIADPTEDGTNLLMASGLIEGDARFVSVKAKTLFSRCHKAFKPFSLNEAVRFSQARNEYLHSSGAGFMAIPPHAWWPKFWALASVLVTALDRDIDDFVGSDREGVVAKHLEQNSKNVEHRTEMLIERAKQRLQQRREGTLSARVAAEWQTSQVLTGHLSYSGTAACPACGSMGTIEGEDITDTETTYEQYSEEDFDVLVTHTIGAEYFSCSVCHLVLDSYELLDQAGVDDSFTVDGDPSDAYEGDYGND
ncbi:hypothetical protein ACFLIM_42040 [Nonomuraea sp. M3C6]|uniref:Uncharacterized protein n=1 Tax=Nonomuraea marmarensis TaxID=3351344 RepID=A0ABW7AUL3_9ACTN